MGDILIRDVSGALKAKLKSASARSGRSLSDEAKAAIAKGLNMESGSPQSAYAMFRSAFAGALLTDAEHAELEDDFIRARKSADRPAADFE